MRCYTLQIKKLVGEWNNVKLVLSKGTDNRILFNVHALKEVVFYSNTATTDNCSENVPPEVALRH